MSRHRWKWTPMRANPTVTAEWLSSQVPSARLCLGTGPGDKMRLCGLLREYPRNNTWKFCQIWAWMSRRAMLHCAS